jgi:lipopolysaccharide export system ATP-binding protein
VLSARNIAKSFDGQLVLADVNLHLRHAEVVGLLGRNGAGKTTLFSILCGLIRPDHGSIWFNDVDVTDMPLFLRAQYGMSYLPQEPSLFRGLTVEQNLLVVLEAVEPDRARRQDRLETMLRQLDLLPIRSTRASRLSGGERRRCEIARTLLTEPKVLLLDEPFAGVDPIAVGEINALLARLTKAGIGVLITDHTVRETLNAVDRAYVIDSGRILMEGTADTIVESPLVRQTYLGEQFRL